MYSIRIDAKVICSACHATGLIRGRGRVIEGTYIQEERDCEACSGRGFRIERVELDAVTLAAIADAIDTVRSPEYAEYIGRHGKE